MMLRAMEERGRYLERRRNSSFSDRSDEEAEEEDDDSRVRSKNVYLRDFNNNNNIMKSSNDVSRSQDRVDYDCDNNQKSSRRRHLSHQQQQHQQRQRFWFFDIPTARTIQRLATPEELELIASGGGGGGGSGGNGHCLGDTSRRKNDLDPLDVPAGDGNDDDDDDDSNDDEDDDDVDGAGSVAAMQDDDDDDDDSGDSSDSSSSMTCMDDLVNSMTNQATASLLSNQPQPRALSNNDEQIILMDPLEQQHAKKDGKSGLLQQSPPSPRIRIIRFVRSRKPVAASKFIMKEVDVDKYMANREMTPLQEKWNALTMIPSPVYCLYFLWSGCWVSHALVDQARQDYAWQSQQQNDGVVTIPGFTGFANEIMGDHHGCMLSSTSLYAWFFRGMPALPPLPIMAVAAGIVLHAPWSFLYHWRYACRLPPGAPRTTHWSRRMDHAMIHAASACLAYGSSGSWDFFVANVLYNADCIYRQFKPKVSPRRNKIRVMLSVLAYTLPILKRGHVALFIQLWMILGTSFYMFATYPIGGWSHSAFHLVIAMAPPLIMNAACTLPASQAQMQLAAQCVVWAEQQSAVSGVMSTEGIGI